MSGHEDAGGEGDDEDDDGLGMWGDGDDDGFAHLEDDEGKVQRKLHLFQNGSIQLSIKRIWDIVPKDEDGMLPMDSYIALNLSLQKSLTQEFVLARAVDSAVGDWGEDVRDGQQTMSAEEFAMFLFELCSLWCGPSISLRVYLFFLNAVFIVITDARGAHTVGLKPLDSVDRLPDSFFELLSVQGWAKAAADEQGLDEEQAMKAWMARNLSLESEHASLLQVQRQIFQVTHDVRSVLLFRRRDGNKREDQDVLGIVKTSSKSLSKVSQVEPSVLVGSSAGTLAGGDRGPSRPRKSADLCQLPWCPPGHQKHPGPSAGVDAHAAVAVAPATKRRGRSAPGQHRDKNGLPAVLDRPPLGVSRLNQSAGAIALPSSDSRGRPWPGDVPVGRAFDVVETRKPRGLVLAGQCAVAPAVDKPPSGWSRVSPSSTSAGHEVLDGTYHRRAGTGESHLEEDGHLSRVPSVHSHELRDPQQPARSPASADTFATRQAPVVALSNARSSAAMIASMRVAPPVAVASAGRAASEDVVEMSQHATQLLSEIADRLIGGDGPLASEAEASFLEGSTLSPAYQLPHKPAFLYKHQTEPALKIKPGTVVFAANKWQKENPLVREPFERSLQKLPAHARPQSQGPPCGPLAHPNEPVWFEMSHRLQVILKKQSRRAERRRKRRMRSKLFRGRGRKQDTRNEGLELREYLDSKAAEHARGFRPIPGQPDGEFLQKVHERYLLNRDRLESRQFRYRGTGGAVVDVYGIGQTPPRPPPVARPVYVPPAPY